MRTTLLLSGVALLSLLCEVSPAHAQAWVPEKGILGLNLGYQADKATELVDGSGEESHNVDTLIQAMLFEVDYTPIDRLGLRLFVPGVASRYSGDSDIFVPHGKWDDRETHYSLTDIRLDARYEVLSDPVVLTPLLGVSIPTMDYAINGFAGVGRHTKKAIVGLQIARTLDPVLPNLYVHGSYELALAEKVDVHPDLEEFSQTQSSIDLSLGYFFTDALSAGVGWSYTLFHDGMNLEDYYDHPGAVRDFHDAVLAEKIMLVGANVGYALSESFGVAVFGRTFISGANTRKAQQIGINFSFNLPLASVPTSMSYEGSTDGSAEASAEGATEE